MGAEMPDSLQIVQKFYPDVRRVKDAKSDVQLEVTKGDVNGGNLKDHKGCVMARACKRALKCDGAIVSTGTIYLVNDDEATRYRVPQAVSREIVAFDRGGKFSPGEYTLKKPERIAPRGSGTRHK